MEKFVAKLITNARGNIKKTHPGGVGIFLLLHMFQVYEMIFDILTHNEIITIVMQIKAPII
jgi:hypothetical protein